MRILVVGAGAIGGYFGGRLLEAGRDVTFLVRAGRAAQLKNTGLVVRSAAAGDFTLANPPMILAEALREPFDLILLSCKAYDLESAIESFAPAVGPQTAILPLLNGMRHLDVLEARFGTRAVLGGQCAISALLDLEGRILHLNDLQSITFGERTGQAAERVTAILAELKNARFDSHSSEAILQDMWEKWVFIASAAGITCLMRSSLGDIVTAGASDLAIALLDECADIARGAGFTARDAALERIRGMFAAAGSTLMASMLRDIERGGPTEVEQILGDLLHRRGDEPADHSLLRIAYAHIKAYEARRARER